MDQRPGETPEYDRQPAGKNAAEYGEGEDVGCGDPYMRNIERDQQAVEHAHRSFAGVCAGHLPGVPGAHCAKQPDGAGRRIKKGHQRKQNASFPRRDQRHPCIAQSELFDQLLEVAAQKHWHGNSLFRSDERHGCSQQASRGISGSRLPDFIVLLMRIISASCFVGELPRLIVQADVAFTMEEAGRNVGEVCVCAKARRLTHSRCP